MDPTVLRKEVSSAPPSSSAMMSELVSSLTQMSQVACCHDCQHQTESCSLSRQSDRPAAASLLTSQRSTHTLPPSEKLSVTGDSRCSSEVFIESLLLQIAICPPVVIQQLHSLGCVLLRPDLPFFQELITNLISLKLCVCEN